MPENYNAFCLASESNKQNLRGRNLGFPIFFRYKHITSVKNHILLAQGESLPYWFLGNIGLATSLSLVITRHRAEAGRKDRRRERLAGLEN